MEKFDLILKDAMVAIPHPKSSSTDVGIKLEQVDIGVLNGKISKLGSCYKDHADSIISLKGLHCLPGVIDSQVHFREPGLTHKEDINTGTKGALLGGVTSIFEMPNTLPPTTTREALNEKMKSADQKAWSHYAFFAGASNDNIESLKDLETVKACSGIKVFVGSSTGNLLVEEDAKIEAILKSTNRRVIFHSEDEFILRKNKHIATESKDVRNHCVWRSVESALSSTQRILNLAEKTNRQVHILHITSEEEVHFLKNKKQWATMEILPQHLTLSAPECYERLGTLAQQNPPIREKRHLEALWKAVVDGTFDVLGSDHAPHTLEEKMKEYPQSPSGMPGVQTLVPIMLDHVHNKKISLERFVELVGEGPRKVFGCINKGRIQVGLDADFTIVDLKKTQTIENKWIASRCGWTPFDGKVVTGWPWATILLGNTAMRENEIILPPQGQSVDFK
jgi:dihydroorotase